jgi:hypothetical protein
LKIAELIDALPAAERDSLLLMAQQYQDAILRENGQKSFLVLCEGDVARVYTWQTSCRDG